MSKKCLYITTAAHFGRAARDSCRDGNDDTTQADNLYRLMDADARTRLVNNRIGALKPVPAFIQKRQAA